MDFVYEQCGNCSRKGVYLVPDMEVARCKYCTASDECRRLHPSSLPTVAAGLRARNAPRPRPDRGRSAPAVRRRGGEVRMEGGLLPMDMATIHVLAGRGARNHSPQRSTAVVTAAAKGAGAGRPTAMVVDDEPTVRALMVATLERAGLAVTQAGSGREACAAILADPPDLVVLDLSMPDMDGLEVLLQLRPSCQIPVLVVSGRSNEGDRVVALELGADDYLAKPFSPAELSARAKAVLARRARRPGGATSSE